MRRWPCQVVAPHPALPRALHLVDDLVGSVVVAEADKDLVEDDVIDDCYAVDRGELSDEATGQVAAALDELGHARTAELAQGGPGGETTGSSRRLEQVVARRLNPPWPCPVRYAAL